MILVFLKKNKREFFFWSKESILFKYININKCHHKSFVSKRPFDSTQRFGTLYKIPHGHFLDLMSYIFMASQTLLKVSPSICIQKKKLAHPRMVHTSWLYFGLCLFLRNLFNDDYIPYLSIYLYTTKEATTNKSWPSLFWFGLFPFFPRSLIKTNPRFHKGA